MPSGLYPSSSPTASIPCTVGLRRAYRRAEKKAELNNAFTVETYGPSIDLIDPFVNATVSPVRFLYIFFLAFSVRALHPRISQAAAFPGST